MFRLFLLDLFNLSCLNHCSHIQHADFGGSVIFVYGMVWYGMVWFTDIFPTVELYSVNAQYTQNTVYCMSVCASLREGYNIEVQNTVNYSIPSGLCHETK